MSILDFGPHTVKCFPEETVIDSNGNPTKRPSSVGVTITGCLMIPISSSDRGTDHVRADYRLIKRALPLGPFARVEFEGRTFAVIEDRHYKASISTEHVSVHLREER